MTRRVRIMISLLLAILLAGSTGCGAGGTMNTGNGSDKTGAQIDRQESILHDEALADQVHRLAETMGFSGSVLVAGPDGIRYAEGFGTADGEGTAANTALTTYAFGSLSKQFTAAAVLKLAEEKKLSLSDPVRTFFPAWPEDRVVTVSQLLHMESGLERDFWNIAYREYGYTLMSQADEFQLSPHEFDELFSLITTDIAKEFHFRPGSEYQYSNINYWLLAEIVGRVSGMSYQDYIRTEFFEPLGLTTAGIDYPDDIAPGHYGGERTEENADLYEGCGSISGNVYDLYAWALALHGAPGAGTDAAAAASSTATTETGPRVLGPAAYRVMTATSAGNYACGLVIDGSVIWHNGQLNGYNSYMSYNTADGTILIVLSNSRTYEFRGKQADFPAEELARLLASKL